MAGVLVVATLVFWILGSGQRQWWAIYVEMPAPITGDLPAAAAAASDAGTSPSDEIRNTDDQRLPTTDNSNLDSARDIFASYMRQEQRKKQQQDF